MSSKESALPAFIQSHRDDAQAIRDELAAGLSRPRAQIAPKFLYDALGSRLFDAITELPEYYPTRTEAGIFRAHGADMASRIPEDSLLIDLGAGSCAKAAALFPVLNPGGYVAVDISVDYLRGALGALQQHHAALPMLGLGLDFSRSLVLPGQAADWLKERLLDRAPRTVFYPGSSIGNFSPVEALALLRQVRAVCNAGAPGGGVLIGVDLVKPLSVLEPAYDDALGVTAAFNRNLLLNVNRWLGADFRPEQWTHRALFDEAASRIEMHLEAQSPQTVGWAGGERRFAAGERIHTENSWKWTTGGFSELLEAAGFGPSIHWTDDASWFGVFWAPAMC